MGKKTLTSEQWETLRERAFRAARGSRMAVETFAETIEAIHDSGLWKKETRSDGSTFATFREFAEYRYPPGLSMSADYSGIPVDGIIEQIMAAAPNRPAIGYLGGKRSSGKRGGNGSNQHSKASKSHSSGKCSTRRDTTAAGMADRLEREFKAIWNAYQRGEFASLTAAAIAAGIRKDPHGAMDAARRAWNKMTTAERKKFAAIVAKIGVAEIETGVL